MPDVVQKLWGFCHTLRHDGIDYGDYIEQITYLLFIKMADERGIELLRGCNWPKISAQSGAELTDHYQKIVVALSETIRIMAEIDNVIESQGGWPKAFTGQ